MRFRLRSFSLPNALLFHHYDGVFPDKGTVHLSEGTLGKKEGFLFSREAFLFSNGAFLFSNGASIFGCRKCRKCTALFLPPKLSVGPRVCVLLYGSRVGELPYEILAELKMWGKYGRVFKNKKCCNLLICNTLLCF